MDTKWLNHPSLQKMEPAKRQIMLDFIKEIQGKPPERAMPSAVAAEAKLKAMNLSFTMEEQSLIKSILMERMNPGQRSQFEMMNQMMNNHNRGKQRKKK